MIPSANETVLYSIHKSFKKSCSSNQEEGVVVDRSSTVKSSTGIIPVWVGLGFRCLSRSFDVVPGVMRIILKNTFYSDVMNTKILSFLPWI